MLSTKDNQSSLLFGRCFEGFEILHGELHDLPDTMAFLRSLSALDSVAELRSPEKRQIRERVAAGALFDWEVVSLAYLISFYL